MTAFFQDLRYALRQFRRATQVQPSTALRYE